MNKRGISDVVVTILIILIGLAAVAIVWGYLQPVLKKDASQITSACIEIALEPLTCTYVVDGSKYNATLQVQRGGDKATIEELKIIVSTGIESEVKASTKIPAPLGTSSITITGIEKQPKEVGIASKIKTEFGAEKLCSESQLKKTCTPA